MGEHHHPSGEKGSKSLGLSLRIHILNGAAIHTYRRTRKGEAFLFETSVSLRRARTLCTRLYREENSEQFRLVLIALIHIVSRQFFFLSCSLASLFRLIVPKRHMKTAPRRERERTRAEDGFHSRLFLFFFSFFFANRLNMLFPPKKTTIFVARIYKAAHHHCT